MNTYSQGDYDSSKANPSNVEFSKKLLDPMIPYMQELEKTTGFNFKGDLQIHYSQGKKGAGVYYTIGNRDQEGLSAKEMFLNRPDYYDGRDQSTQDGGKVYRRHFQATQEGLEAMYESIYADLAYISENKITDLSHYTGVVKSAEEIQAGLKNNGFDMGSLSFMQDGGEIGTEEIVVTGKRTGKSVNNPTSVLHPNYNTWQAGMSSYIPEEIVEGDYLNARLGGGKNVFGQYKGNKTNKKSTAGKDLTGLNKGDLGTEDADELRYTDAVESNKPKKVSIKEGLKNLVDNLADTYSKPLDTVKDVETEAKKLVDNSIENLAMLFPETGAAVTSVNDTLRPFGTDYSSTATAKLLTKYTTPNRFVSALKADPVGTLADIGLVVGATVLGTRFGAPASTVALGPLYNKYSMQDGGKILDKSSKVLYNSNQAKNYGLVDKKGKAPPSMRADDVPMTLKEGDFVLSQPAVNLYGKDTIERMVNRASKEAGTNLKSGGKVPVNVHNGEYIIPKNLTKYIGSNVLENMNNRGLMSVGDKTNI